MTRKTLFGGFVFVFFFFSVLPILAQRGDDTNRLSKNGRVEGKIAAVNVTLEYGRPKVGGREIWGGLVPYDQIWRSGADEATKITFSSDVLVEGQALPAGTYSLFTIPRPEEWTVIFNKVATQWGPYQYDKLQDALRVFVKPEAIEMVEELTYHIEGNKIALKWEKLRIAFAIAVPQ